MGRRRRVMMRVAWVLVVIGAIGASACHHDETESSSTTGTQGSSTKPVDHLAPGELLEGPEKAFGIALPKEVAVEKRFVDVVYAAGEPPPASVAKYFAARVEGGKVTTGERGTTFEGVHAAAAPDLSLRIEVGTNLDGPLAGRGSRVTVRDLTAPKQPDLPDEAARWNAAGLTPDGKIADPKHLH